jgi:hypothetical protein
MRSPGWSRRLAAFAASGTTAVAPEFSRQLHKAAMLAEEGYRCPAALLSGLAGYLGEIEKSALVSPDARAGLAPAWRLFDGLPPDAATDLETLSRRLTNAHFALSLPSEMLRKVDMMSMRASVEVRVPMLDEAVVACGLALPHRNKTDGRRGKIVLRTLAHEWLPPAVAGHPKQGFNIPLDSMVPPGFHDLLGDLLLADGARTAGLLSQTVLTPWLERFRHPATGDELARISRWGLYQRVFTMLALELWLRDHALTW